MYILLLGWVLSASPRAEFCPEIREGQLNRCGNLRESSISGSQTVFQKDTQYGDFSRSRWSSLKPEGVNFSNSRLRQLTWDRSRVRSCQLKNVDAVGAVIDRVHFIDSDLQGADFSGAKLNQVKFTRSQLRGAKFVNAVLRFVDFEGSDLSDVDFSGAELIGSSKINAE